MLHGSRHFLLAAALFASAIAYAQPYPSKSIRFIVTQGPGGTSDLFARVIAPKMSAELGQSVVVDNRAGAEGVIGTEMTARSAPDGYTIVFSNNGVLPMNRRLYKKLPYDPNKDFDAISLLGYVTYGVFVNPNLPASTFNEFIALAKAKPGSLNYGAGGATAHVGTEMFKSAMGIKMTYVPYKSNPAALTDLIGGAIQVMLLPLVAAPQAKTGQIRPLAVHAPVRQPILPNVPTLIELGINNFEFTGWGAIHGPAGMARDRVQRLNAVMVKVLAMPDVIEGGRGTGFELQSTTPEQLDALVRSDQAKYAKVIKEVGISPE